MSSGDGMIPVEKYHGTENDFLVVDTKATEVPDHAAFAIAHCDRETGLNPGPHGKRHGADGVLFLAIEEGHDPMRVNMELVQPDGSSAEMCGNGLRCAAYWASNQTDEAAFVVATPVGSRQATVKDEAVTVEMGRPSFHPEDVTARVRRTAGRDIHRKSDRDGGEHGRPHAVAFVEDISATDLAAVAPSVRHTDIFLEGANVTLAAVDSGEFRQRTFERGIEGETRACGTGTIAIVACAKRLGRNDSEKVRVSLPGGVLVVTVPGDDGPALLSGPAVRSYGTKLKASPV